MNSMIQEFLNSNQVTVLSKTTQDNYRYALQHLSAFYDGLDSRDKGRGLSSGKETMLSSFCQYLEKKKKSGATIQQYITIVKMYFRYHKIPVEFTYRIPVREKKKQQLKSIHRWFDESAVADCLDYAFAEIRDPGIQLRNRLLARLVAETGARIQEVAKICGKDFDPENNTVFLEKSKTEPRPAFYSQDTALLLDQYLEKDLFGNRPAEERVFPSTDQCKKIISAMLRSLGLKSDGDGRGPHTFRHFVATKLYYDGEMDLNDLAIVLGDKPETIRESYLHPTPAMLRRRVQKAWGWTE